MKDFPKPAALDFRLTSPVSVRLSPILVLLRTVSNGFYKSPTKFLNKKKVCHQF